jgi:hypothetical protein
MSSFRRIGRYDPDDDFITVKESETVNIRGTRYRKAFDYFPEQWRQEEIYHYIHDQKDCAKICVSNVWYVQVKPHRCTYNCKDSGQSDKEWLAVMRALPDKSWYKKRIGQILEALGYSNKGGEGMIRIG